MASNIFLCGWEKTSEGFRLWVKSRPAVFGQGPTYRTAEEELVTAISEAFGEEVPVPEYDPPLPPDPLIAPFFQPELYLLKGDAPFELSRPRVLPFAEPKEREHQKAYFDSFYENGPCQSCQYGLGNRSDRPLKFQYIPSGVDAGLVSLSKNTVYLFSKKFLSLLTLDELSRFEFYPASKPWYSFRHFFELRARPAIPFVGVREFDTKGKECGECGHRFFSIQEPLFQDTGMNVRHFVCRSDLPTFPVSCFPVGSGHEISICITRARWDQIRGRPEARGICTEALGVVDEENCDRTPRLQIHPSRPCSLCTQEPWVEPADLYRKRLMVWPLPGNFRFKEMIQWLQWAITNQQVTVTRQPMPFERLLDVLEKSPPAFYPIVFSFRCPECWKLGRIIANSTEVIFDWW